MNGSRVKKGYRVKEGINAEHFTFVLRFEAELMKSAAARTMHQYEARHQAEFEPLSFDRSGTSPVIISLVIISLVIPFTSLPKYSERRYSTAALRSKLLTVNPIFLHPPCAYSRCHTFRISCLHSRAA